jgi:hypothetical protein
MKRIIAAALATLPTALLMKEATLLRRMVFVSIVGALALLVSTGPAFAAPVVPHGTPLEPTQIPAGQLCPFDLLIEGVSGAATRATLPSGTDVITGPAFVKITNQDTGKSATYNISGPGFISDTGEIVLTGQGLIFQFPEVGPPFLIVTNGRVAFPENAPIETFNGRIAHDVCAELIS